MFSLAGKVKRVWKKYYLEINSKIPIGILSVSNTE